MFLDLTGDRVSFKEIGVMANYRTATMFESFGLPEKLSKSFVSHWRQLIRRAQDPKERRRIRRRFRTGKPIYIGGSNVRQILQAIIEHYGEPQIKLPNRVFFGIMQTGAADAAGYNTEANFLMDGVNGEFFVIIASDDIFNIPIDIAETISHESQHFLRSLYEGGVTQSEEGSNTIETEYGDPWEVQAYAGNIASTVMAHITSIFELGIDGKSEDLIAGMKRQMMLDRDNFVRGFLLKAVNHFFSNIEGHYKETFPVELKRQYYVSALKDFGRLFEKYFS